MNEEKGNFSGLSLQEMVLGYCRQVGALIEPPAYGIYDILLPDDVAARLGIEPLQHITFDQSAETGNANVLQLHYGSPLVEKMVEELRDWTANERAFANNVRLEKPGLFALIEKTLALPNAKIFPVHGAVERRRIYHYLRFNFKASLIADEKRELLLPIWMHLQGGYPVQGEEIERLMTLDAESQFPTTALAEPLFVSQANPLSEEVLLAVLERARRSAGIALGETLSGLQQRLQRYLELDRARLNQYYDDLKKDGERRLQKAEEDRRSALETKVAAIETERQVKLADVEQKYRLRVDLDLVNIALIGQPKIDLTVEIRKRTASIQRQVVWDPLRHQIEPLVCDVCGLAGGEMYLCENGHLAHENCMAPQCVECKRTFCQKCSDQVEICVVCDRPVCVHSMVRCPECQRVTCHEHVQLCHAEHGAPRRIVPDVPAVKSGESTVSGKTAASAEKKPTAVKETGKKEGRKQPAPTAKTPVKKAGVPAVRSRPPADRVDIYFGPDQPLISAYVMHRKKQVAVRSWELQEEGIAVYCDCDRWPCEENGLIYRPFTDETVESQLMGFIREFIAEYGVPESKWRYFRMRVGEQKTERKLMLTGKWRDPAALQAAREGFERLRIRNRQSAD